MGSLFKLFRYMLPLRKSDTDLNQECWEAKPAEPKKTYCLPFKKDLCQIFGLFFLNESIGLMLALIF